MKQFLARAIEFDSLSRDLLRISFAASDIPPCSPGQFFLVRPNLPLLDPYLRSVWFAPRLVGDRADFWVSDVGGGEGSSLENAERHLRSRGEREFDLIGALGQGFDIPPQARALLVVAENARFAAPLIGLIEMLVKQEREVVFACGEPALPDQLIPPEVEYRVEVKALGELGDARQWSEFLIASGTRVFLDELEATAAHRTQGSKLLSDIPFPCGVGACYTCALETRSGIKLACHDGPVFDLNLGINIS